MTKEQILKNNGLYIGFKSTYSWDCIIVSMQEYADQELSKEREKAKKLVEALNVIKDLTQNVLIVQKIKQSLTEYEKL